MSANPNPSVHVIAGPNGAGKTTFVREFLPMFTDYHEFVNADLIARGISPYDPEASAVEAGKIALKRIRELIAHNHAKDLIVVGVVGGDAGQSLPLTVPIPLLQVELRIRLQCAHPFVSIELNLV